MIQLLGLTGKARVGKDTVANYLIDHYGFSRVRLAGPLKAMLRAIGVDGDNEATKDVPHPVFGVSPRHMMQTLGTDWMRKMVCEDGWLRLAEVAIKDNEFGWDIVIPDVRFDNEAELIHRLGGVVVEIIRPAAPAVQAHTSEAGVSRQLIDLQIYNGSTIEKLCRAVVQTIRLQE